MLLVEPPHANQVPTISSGEVKSIKKTKNCKIKLNTSNHGSNDSNTCSIASSFEEQMNTGDWKILERVNLGDSDEPFVVLYWLRPGAWDIEIAEPVQVWGLVTGHGQQPRNTENGVDYHISLLRVRTP